MNTVTTYILYIFVSGLLSIGAYFVKSLLNRVSDLEKKDSMTEIQVRQLLSDKIQPLQENLNRIESQLDKILEYLIRDHHSD